MKYRVFEQAAAEARAEIQELDAEIDRLKAERELLRVAEALLRQVLAAVPMSTDALPADEAPPPDPRAGEASAEPPAREEALLELNPEPLQPDEWLGSEPDDATASTPPVAPSSSADMLPDHLVVSLQTEEMPSALGASAAEEVSVPEQSSGRDARSEDNSDSPQTEDAPDDPPADWPTDHSDPARPSFADLLARKEPFSLRKQGWPESSGVDEGEIRKKLL